MMFCFKKTTQEKHFIERQALPLKILSFQKLKKRPNKNLLFLLQGLMRLTFWCFSIFTELAFNALQIKQENKTFWVTEQQILVIF